VSTRWLALGIAAAVAACAGMPDGPSARKGLPAAKDPVVEQPVTPPEDAATAPSPDADDDAAATPPQEQGQDEAPSAVRPAWLGTRPLPLRPDGIGEAQPTPPELIDRRLPPPPGDLPPLRDNRWWLSIDPVPTEVLSRSTWHERCPVTPDDLRYLTFPYWGFDDRAHPGELLVHHSVAEGVGEVFRRLFAARFPLEEVRVIAAPELDAPATGDGNVTTAFVCRSTVEGQRWSDHAFGTAIELNPFHNPYVRGDIVIPELATAYVDRAWHRPGMIQPGDEVVTAFMDIGWGWGGAWQSAKDWMHFSLSGR
jgi:hypothetical protein